MRTGIQMNNLKIRLMQPTTIIKNSREFFFFFFKSKIQLIFPLVYRTAAGARYPLASKLNTFP